MVHTLQNGGLNPLRPIPRPTVHLQMGCTAVRQLTRKSSFTTGCRVQAVTQPDHDPSCMGPHPNLKLAQPSNRKTAQSPVITNKALHQSGSCRMHRDACCGTLQRAADGGLYGKGVK